MFSCGGHTRLQLFFLLEKFKNVPTLGASDKDLTKKCRNTRQHWMQDDQCPSSSSFKLAFPGVLSNILISFFLRRVLDVNSELQDIKLNRQPKIRLFLAIWLVLTYYSYFLSQLLIRHFSLRHFIRRPVLSSRSIFFISLTFSSKLLSDFLEVLKDFSRWQFSVHSLLPFWEIRAPYKKFRIELYLEHTEDQSWLIGLVSQRLASSLEIFKVNFV